MSKETKIGLLVGLFVILTFACILHMRLAGDQQIAELENENQGVHVLPADDVVAGPEAAGRRQGDDETADQTAVDWGTEETVEGDDSSRDEETGFIVVRRAQGEHDDQSQANVRRQDAAAEDEPGQQDEPPLGPRFYTVVAGDSLYRIAEKTLGPGQGPQWRRIADANPALSDPSRLRPGMKIAIPAARTPPRPAADTVEQEGFLVVDNAATARSYIVQPGDTLGEISTKVYGTSRKWRMIREANGNLDPRALRPGLKLTIPGVEETVIARSDPAAIERALEQVAQFVDSTSGPPSGIYRVKRGETLYAIARRVLGDGERWKEIYELNHREMASPEDLAAGQKILLPSLEQIAMLESPRY